MIKPVLTILSKLARKLIMAAFMAGLALVAYSLWVYVRDNTNHEERRDHALESIRVDRAELRTAFDEAKTRRAETVAALEAQRQRANQIDKTLATLGQIAPGPVDRVLGDAETKKAHDERTARMRAMKTETQTRIVELERDFVAHDTAQAELANRLSQLDEEELALKREKYAVEHYVRTAWHEARWLFITVFLVYLVGGLIFVTLLYYCWAPWITRGRPVELPSSGAAVPSITESRIMTDAAIWPGEVLWVRKTALQGGDSALTRRKRLMLSWRMPFTSLAAGLVRLVELRNGRSDGERRVAFASTEDHFAEFVVVSIPEGSSFVLRARFLMGIIAGLDQPPVIRRRWRFFHWQSWVTGQFGYLQFYGPCRLIVSSATALKIETLEPNEDGKAVSRRLSQAGCIGLSPRLEFKPVRSKGYLRYCRHESPLFDLEATGVGVVLSRDPKGRGRDSLLAEILKPFGI